MFTFISCGRQVVHSNRISDINNSSQGEQISLINEEIILEGTVIDSERGFYEDGVYSSCLIEVNRIFKGSVEDRVLEVIVSGGSIGKIWQTLSHGQIILPPKNTTAIFRLKELVKDNNHKKLLELTPFNLFYPTGDIEVIYPIESNDGRSINIEEDIYQKIESETGEKRRSPFLPRTYNEIAIDYSISHNLLLPNRNKGLIYRLSPIQETKYEDYIGYNIQMLSSNSACYLDRGSLMIEYNSEVFGENIVTSGELLYEIPTNYNSSDSYRINGLPEHFEVTIKDLTPNKLLIEWENTLGIDGCLQLLPGKVGANAIMVYFLPKNDRKRVNIQLIGVDSNNLHYDYEHKEMIPFEYIAVPEMVTYPAGLVLPAKILDIQPNESFQLLDTVHLIGKNFQYGPKISIYAKGKSGHYRYREIPENHIYRHSDTIIEIIIPMLALSNEGKDLSREWVPTTGKIKITKGFEDYEVMTFSREEIVIKD